VTSEPTIALAFLAGLVSFISPCVLPLIPAYVGYMGGQATKAAGQEGGNTLGTFLHGLAFVLGFTIFFVGFGLITTAAAQQLANLGLDIPQILTRLGGVAVIFFGLYVMKVLDPVFERGLRLAEWLKTHHGPALAFTLAVGSLLLAYFYWVFEGPLLALLALMLSLLPFHRALKTASNLGDFWYRAIQTLQYALISDTRNISVQAGTGGYLGSIGMGIVFSAGWTPCIGPIYGSILTLAADSALEGGSLIPAAAMLTAYSWGLGIPFLATALALNQMTGLMRGLKRNMRKVEYASGLLLIMVGVLVLSGSMTELARRFGQDGELGDISVRLEACTASAAEGRIGAGSWPECVRQGYPKLDDRLVFASLKGPKAGAADTPPLLTAISPSDSAPAQGVGQEALTPLLSPPSESSDTAETGITLGKQAPDFATTAPDGAALRLSDFRGQVVLLNFWATWCGPCRNEMPEFQAVYEQLQTEGFTVLAVNMLEKPEAVQAFMDELGLSFPIALDPAAEINDQYQIRQYPTSFLIDQNGIIRQVHAGELKGEVLVGWLNALSLGG
jgi:cytochrome c biogenesis protein CcdA/peroxiredoxin